MSGRTWKSTATHRNSGMRARPAPRAGKKAWAVRKEKEQALKEAAEIQIELNAQVCAHAGAQAQPLRSATVQAKELKEKARLKREAKVRTGLRGWGGAGLKPAAPAQAKRRLENEEKSRVVQAVSTMKVKKMTPQQRRGLIKA